MANQTCKLCEQEPAAFLVTELSTGDTVYIGVLCLPPFAKTVWEDAGLPELVLDIVEAGETEPATVESDALANGSTPEPKSQPAPPTQGAEDANGFFDPELAETASAPADVEG